MRYRLQRHDGTDCSATMVPITVLRMVPIQRYRHHKLWGFFYFQTEVICFINVFPPSPLNEFNIIVLFKGGIEIKNVLNSYRIKDV